VLPTPKHDPRVRTLFVELRIAAPDVLEALRDCPDDPVAIARWAKSHHLDSPSIIKYACFVRHDWADNSRRAARLMPLSVLELYGSTGESADRQDARPGILPAPRESMREWLRRAGDFYRSRKPQPEKRRRGGNRDESPRHCLWFIEVDVTRRMGKTAVAKRAGKTYKTVHEAIKHVRADLGLQPRKLPPGRPRKS
jgi:hypothetical protein